MSIKPMLAAKYEEAKIHAHLAEGPLVMQPKIDGMRIVVSDERLPLSRSGKEYKQKHIRRWLQDHPSLIHMDGEAVAGHVYNPEVFRESMSGIRAEDGAAEFSFYAFDRFGEVGSRGYQERRASLEETIGRLGGIQEANGYHARLVLCPQIIVNTIDEINVEEERLIALGWEGAILRNPRRPYKHGRSTAREGTLIKLKRFEDAEAIVVGYEPWYVNGNDAVQSPLGFTVRSAHQENLTPIERLGVLKVELLTDRSVKFGIGVMRGVTHADRDRMWVNRESLIGKICTFAHQGYGGGYDVPRTPVFLNWRNAIDL